MTDRFKHIALFFGVVLVFFLLGALVLKFLYPAWDFWTIWWVYSGYVQRVSDITGMNRYLVTALAIAFFVPFYYGASKLASFSIWELTPFGGERKAKARGDRLRGALVLGVLAVVYNLSLYWATQDLAFEFATGKTLQWYALTPNGVKFYDRAGTDPEFGIALKPVTPEIIHRLRLAQKGKFVPIDPRKAVFFNPITGEAQAWYVRYPDGTFEFYETPGFHPVTGAPLTPVTKEVYFQWQELEKKKGTTVVVPPVQGPAGTSGTSPLAPGKPPSPTAPIAVAVLLEVESEPSGAEVFLDWASKGRTPLPLRFQGKRASGLLVILKDGHQAAIRALDQAEDARLSVALPADRPHPRTRLLLVADASVGEAVTTLRGRLVEEGFSVLGREEAREFERERQRAVGLSNRAFREWARARFQTDRLLTAKASRSSRELSKQELGYLGIQEAVKGAIRAEVTLLLEVVDLASGDAVAAVSVKGAGFGLDPGQGFEKATTQAVTESAKQLKQKLAG